MTNKLLTNGATDRTAASIFRGQKMAGSLSGHRYSGGLCIRCKAWATQYDECFERSGLMRSHGDDNEARNMPGRRDEGVHDEGEIAIVQVRGYRIEGKITEEDGV